MQLLDASQDHAHPANRNGPGGMAGAAWPQIIARAQRRHESAELPRPQRLRTRAIRARAFQLHVVVSNATVICHACDRLSLPKGEGRVRIRTISAAPFRKPLTSVLSP